MLVNSKITIILSGLIFLTKYNIANVIPDSKIEHLTMFMTHMLEVWIRIRKILCINCNFVIVICNFMIKILCIL